MLKKNRAPVIVITGGTGSGKSTVAAVFKKQGARVVDVDRLAHRLLKPGGEAWREIIREFCGVKYMKKKGSPVSFLPEDFVDVQGNRLPERPWAINAAGVIRRDKLGARVFSDPASLEILNKITHSRLRKLLDAKIRLHHKLSRRPIILDMAVYPAKSFRGMGDAVLWVRAPGGLRVQRLADSKRLSMEEASIRVRIQSKDEEYEKNSDFILPNLGSDMDVKKGAEEVWPRILSKITGKGGR
ncbi:dephospho-CoA kinase [bacterium]|nr:dephospho-CoA kinase [bacterium]